MSVPIVGYGAGGHARSLLDAIASGDGHEVVALVDDTAEGDLLGVPIRPAADLGALRADGVEHAFVGVGGVVERAARRDVFARLDALGFALPPIVHATATVSAWADLGRGAQVLTRVVVCAQASIGDGAILNTGAIVEHDCRVGASAHVGPGAVLGGHVTVGDGAHVGLGASVVEGVTIGPGALVAAGAVVVEDVAAGATVRGVPAR